MTEIDQVLAELPETKSIKRAKDISTHAQLLKKAADAAQVSPQLRASLAEVQLRGRYRAGQLLAAMPRGRPRKKVVQDDLFVTLEALGISRDQSSQWQRIAKIPERELDALIRDRGEELTTADALALAKRLDRRKSDKQEQDARRVDLATVDSDASGDGWMLLGGEFQSRLSDLPDGSVDLVVTDPPYPEEALPLWSDLSQHAARVLSDQGMVVALTGAIYLPEVMNRMGEHLNYGWVYIQPLPGANSRIMGRHILQSFKPWVAFTKSTWPSGRIDWHPDLLDPSARAKDAYRWQQDPNPAKMLVDALCPEGGTVLDPFTGTGSYGVAALELDRQFIGVEADAKRLDSARTRLGKCNG